MVTACEIARKANLNFYKAGGETLIKIEDLDEFLDIAKKMRAIIVGIEGFYVRDGSRIPDMNLILDFSEIRESIVSVEMAAKLVAQHPISEDYYLNFVFRDDATA